MTQWKLSQERRYRRIVMSDLIKRLEQSVDDPLVTTYMSEQTLVDAIDEIERLQARVDALEGANARQFKLIEAIRSNVKAALATTGQPDFPDGTDAEGFPGGDKRFDEIERLEARVCGLTKGGE